MKIGEGIGRPDRYARYRSDVRAFSMSVNTDLRDLFTSRPDFSGYSFQAIQYAQQVNPLWVALTRDVDFSRPDSDEVTLHAAIMKSEGLPRPRAAPKAR